MTQHPMTLARPVPVSAPAPLPPAPQPKRYRRRRFKQGAALLALAGGAAGLAAAAAYVQLRSRQAERDNPPAGRFVEVDGVRLHYIERGEGEPLVLLHGNGALTRDFELSGLVARAAKKYRVVVFDRPGYGYSERPRGRVWTPEAQARLFRHAFARLRLERPVVLGHSWGAMVALALALRHPLAVKGVVLVSGYYRPSLRTDVPLFAPPAIPVVGDLLRFTISPLVTRLLWPGLMRKLFGPNDIPRHFEHFPKWMALRPGQIRASAAETALMIPAAVRLGRRYARLSVPAVVVGGKGDLIVNTAWQAQALHRRLPGSRLHVIPGVGHMVHHIAPEAVLDAIDEAARMGAEPLASSRERQLAPA